MKFINTVLIVFTFFYISCATNSQNATVPMYGYDMSDYSFDSPRDVKISVKPGTTGKWMVNCISEGVQNAEVVAGSSLETILATVFPDGDAFKKGKIIQSNKKETLPYFNMVIKDDTELSIRALSVGKLNK